MRHDYYKEKARNQHEKKFILLGARGNIYDRNGLALATSQQCFSIFCTPRYTRNEKSLARKVAALSHRSVDEIKKLIEKGTFFWIERKVDLETRDRYLEVDDPSIGFTHDLRRQYTMPEMFVNLIGKCGSDNRGIEGLELQLDDVLSGTSGFTIYQKDPTGDMFPYHDYPEKNPQPGSDVYLTIDLQLQAILYTNLRECLIEENAHHAAGLIIDPRTGELLALVNVGNDGDERNHVVCDEFEPGSTFKLVTLTYALLNGFKEDDVIDTEHGKVKIRGHVIHDDKNYGVVTVKQAIAHSSNVAMAKISKQFNYHDFFILMRDLGFGQLTGIELPGEVKGKLPDPQKMNSLEFATITFGQGITVNLLQLAFAYQAIANKGILYKPFIINEMREGERIIHRVHPLRVRHVVDESTAARITDILCNVVEKGSGAEASLKDIRVAGKTGTAQKVVDGKYSNSSIVTTFIGYFPAESPEYLIAIMLDEPQKGLWASSVAAPVFKTVAQRICHMNSHHYAVK
jgi:cell division protein FtsI/penicillin-binding protein 2